MSDPAAILQAAERWGEDEARDTLLIIWHALVRKPEFDTAAYVEARIAASLKGDAKMMDSETDAAAYRAAPASGDLRPEPPRCGEVRVTDANLIYACRRPLDHDGDHHPNPCGHDGCTGLECLRGK
jgi:hypothetical protein